MLTLIIKPTHRCNLNCSYCYDKDSRTLDQTMMSLETLENIFKIASTKTDEITVVWHGGEPLLMGIDFYVKAYEAIIPKYFDLKKVKSTIQTNGTILSPEVLALFEKYQISMGSSYDGVTNNQTRRNTERLKSNMHICKELDMPYWTSFLMVVTKDNAHTLIDSLEESILEGYEFGYSVVFRDQSVEEGLEEMKIVTDALLEMLEYAIYKTNVIPRPFDYYINEVMEIKGNNLCDNIYCQGKWLGIHPDGTIFPCGREWYGSYTLGNVNKISTFAELVTDKPFIKYNNDIMKGLIHCKDCPLFSSCRGGCPNTKYTIYKDLTCHDEVQCYHTKAMYNGVYDLLKNLDLSKVSNAALRKTMKSINVEDFSWLKNKLRGE